MPFPTEILRISELIADRIVGAFIATAESGARWVLSPGSQAVGAQRRLDAYGNAATEINPGGLAVQTVGSGFGGLAGQLTVYTPAMENALVGPGGALAGITMIARDGTGQVAADPHAEIALEADTVTIGKPDSMPISRIWFGTVSVTLNAAVSGGQVITHNAGRQASAVICTTIGTQTYFGICNSSGVNAFTVGAAHKDNTASTATISVGYVALWNG